MLVTLDGIVMEVNLVQLLKALVPILVRPVASLKSISIPKFFLLIASLIAVNVSLDIEPLTITVLLFVIEAIFSATLLASATTPHIAYRATFSTIPSAKLNGVSESVAPLSVEMYQPAKLREESAGASNSLAFPSYLTLCDAISVPPLK